MFEASMQVGDGAEPLAPTARQMRRPDFLLRFDGARLRDFQPLRNERLVGSLPLAGISALDDLLDFPRVSGAPPGREREFPVPGLVVIRSLRGEADRSYDVHIHLAHGDSQLGGSGEILGLGFVLGSSAQSAGAEEVAYLLRREEEARRRERRLRAESEALLACLQALMSQSGVEEKCKRIFDAFAGVLDQRDSFVFRRSSREAFLIVASSRDRCVGSPVRAASIEWLFKSSLAEAPVPGELAADLEHLGVTGARRMVILGAPIRIDRETALMAVLKRPEDASAPRDRMLFERLTALTSQAIESEERRASITELGRLAALGDLLSFVAHEINQPLSTIAMSAQNALTLCERSGDLDAVRRRLERIKAFALRAGETVQHVRALVYPAKARPFQSSSNLSEVIGSVLNLLREGLERNGIELRVDLPDADLTAWGHPVSLQQVLLNLVVNARDAVRELQSRDGNGHERWIHVRVEPDTGSGWVVLRVADSGGGIPADVMPRIFDKFYTLKESGLGTGLGLAIVHELVSEIGGSIEVENGDLGAIFTILLPAGDDPAGSDQGDGQ